MIQGFGEGFLFGTATAAYQIEGGWNEDGKGRSIWDRFTHTRGKVVDSTNGDIACDTYHDFQTDIDLMSELNLQAYRFSISWSRVLPQGYGEVNQAGLDYYDRLVDALLAKGIRPFVTLFHWDTPDALFTRYKGFAGRQTAHYFADYARLIIQRLGDRVKDWITLNEPWEHAMLGHFLGRHAPGIKNPWTYFRVAHHELLGHGLAVQAMRSERSDLNIGITLSQFPIYPARYEPTGKDMDSVELADMFINRFFLDGVFKGRYPERLMKRLWPIVPRIKPGDMQTIAQPLDFLGVNYYGRIFAERKSYIPFLRTWVEREPSDARYHHPTLGGDAFPEGFKELAKRYREDYGNPVVYITENGVSGGGIHDESRIEYLRQYLGALKEAIDEGADIRGYFYWTLMDNFEWNLGLTCPMGLLQVDHATQQRTVRDSGWWYRDLIAAQRGGA